MYFPLILFFGSLLGIIYMVSRKLFLLQNGKVSYSEERTGEAPDLEEWKKFTLRTMKKAGHVSLVETIRVYVKSTTVLKNKYKAIGDRIKENRKDKLGEEIPEKKEVNNFLKMISQYKRKIRKITEKIKREENF